MASNLTASNRKSLIRLASTLPAGSEERRAILAGLSKSAADVDPKAELRRLKRVVDDLDRGILELNHIYVGGVKGRDGSGWMDSRLEKALDSFFDAADELSAAAWASTP